VVLKLEIFACGVQLAQSVMIKFLISALIFEVLEKTV
jgi:hypothetical protein